MNKVDRPGKGLFVVGVGRSGTSVATRLAATLALRLPREDDIMAANVGNPHGYWESSSLAHLNDKLLAAVSSNWWRPPTEHLDDHAAAEFVCFTEDARSSFVSSFGLAPGWVWKDPRLTVLLPFWESVVGPHPILLPYRRPQVVARSISTRDGLTYSQGLALWEAHMRHALSSTRGRAVLIASYESLIADPERWRDRLTDFCDQTGIATAATRSSLDEIVYASKTESAGPLTADQRHLYDLVCALDGAHQAIAVPPLDRVSDETLEQLATITAPTYSTIE